MGDFRFEGGRHAARRILAEKKRPTGVVVANDMMALGAMQEFKAAGLSIPYDGVLTESRDRASSGRSSAAYRRPAASTWCRDQDPDVSHQSRFDRTPKTKVLEFHDLRTSEQISSGAVHFPTISVKVPSRIGTDRLRPANLSVRMDKRVQTCPSFPDYRLELLLI